MAGYHREGYHRGRSLTKEYCAEVCKNYKTQNDLRRGDSSVYKKAKKMGWLDEFIPLARRINFTKDYCRNIAKNYRYRRELELNDTPVYQKCCREGWIEEFFPEKQFRELNEEYCRKVAENYKYRVDIKHGDVGVYNWLRSHGLINELFPKYKNIKSRNDVIYIIETNIVEKDKRVHKIGVTSSSLGMKRPEEVILNSKIPSKVVLYAKLKENTARKIESQLLSIGEVFLTETKFPGFSEYRKYSEKTIQEIMDMIKNSKEYIWHT